MALTTSTITGRVPLPDDANPTAAEIVFVLSGYDTEGNQVIPGGAKARFVLDDGDMPAGAKLWRNTEGLRGTVYAVEVAWSEAGRRETLRRTASLGVVQVGDDASYTIAELLNATPVPVPDNTYWRSITQQDYDDMMQAKADAETAAASVNLRAVDDVAALAALDEDQYEAAAVTEGLAFLPFVWDPTDLSAEITANDPRYVAPASDPTGASGARVMAGSVWNEVFSGPGLNPVRYAGRWFGGEAVTFDGSFTHGRFMKGLPQITKELHPWLVRDTEWIWMNQAGVAAVTGYARSANADKWPGWPSYAPYSMGIQAAFVNDGGSVYHHGGAVYAEATRMPGSGYTVAGEFGLANYGSESIPTPFNLMTSGGGAGVNLWLQVGAGQDRVYKDALVNPKSTAAYATFKTSFLATGGMVEWRNATTYAKGAHVADGYGGAVDVVRVAHTTPASGSFADFKAANPSYYAPLKHGTYAPDTYNQGDLATSAYFGATFVALSDFTATEAIFETERQTNPSRWKQLPSAKRGLVFGVGSLEEIGPGSGLSEVVSIPQRHRLTWYRDNAGVPEASAFILGDSIPNGSPIVGMSFRQGLIDFTATSGIRADAARIGGTTNYATISRPSGANEALVVSNPGTSVILFYQGGAEVARLDSAGINLPAGKVLRVNSQQVVGAAKTGWGVPTGTADRTTFATYTAPAISNPPTQAEVQAIADHVQVLSRHFMALVQDLHINAGHGLLRAS